MFGLAPYSGGPFSSVLQLQTTGAVSGLTAVTTLRSVSAVVGPVIAVTGLQAVTTLRSVNSTKGPVMWTSIITVQ